MTETIAKPKALPRVRTERPRLYKVILLNDDFTPRDFVVSVLMGVFRMTEAEALGVMLTAHRRGACVVAVYTREVVKRALELSATALILVHNHPSGDPTPSRADIDMTRMIIDSAKPLGITVHDHIIIGRDGHASLKGLRII